MEPIAGTTPKILRSILFVPADSESKLAKIPQITADAVVLDWEDAVLPQNKAAARSNAAGFLKRRERSRQEVLIRLNPVGSSEFNADCDALNTSALPDGFLLSKCRGADEVLDVDGFLKEIDRERRCVLYAQIESPSALLQCFEIASGTPRVAGLAFGAEDFSAEMGITRTADEIELLYARSALVTAARAAGVEAYDSPCLDFRNEEKQRTSARRARNLGFSGQLAIHPSQAPILNEIFSPAEGEIAEARRLIETFESSPAGVFAVDGKMVDEAILRRARRVLELARMDDKQRNSLRGAIS